MPRLIDLFVSLALAGCFGSASVITEEPPPPRAEMVMARPGYVWVDGNWVRDDGQWMWRGGYYERTRPGSVYVAGRWERHGDRRIYVPGTWRGRTRVVIR